MTGMLASVRSLEEARLVAATGVDIIDLKDPAHGALGALPVEAVTAIASALRGGPPASATIGDLPMEPERVAEAVAAMAATGVEFVKIGFFPGGNWSGVLDSLSRQPVKAKLIAVLFGDAPPPLEWVPLLAGAGFSGAMLDTMDKTGGALPVRCPGEYLREFVESVHGQGMLCGLAGSLRTADVPSLLRLHPDYLGFRGALCERGRTGRLNPDAVLNLAELIRRYSAPLSAERRAGNG